MTQRATRLKPTTSWAARSDDIETSRAARHKPMTHKAPLQDAYRKVHDQDNRIIYILTNTGIEIPGTFWKTRPLVP